MAKIGRNQPCPCGSGTKFKKCCGAYDKTSPPRALNPRMDAAIAQKIREMNAREQQRQKQQGLGRGIVSWETGTGHRMVAVANRVHWSASWKTFHDFLRHFLIEKLGKEWWKAEVAKAQDERHPIVRWYEQAIADSKKHGVKQGDVYVSPMTGAQRAFLNLAYNVYLIAHHADGAISDTVVSSYIDKLKSTRTDDFVGKLFETYAAAAFLKAGFTLEYEDEANGGSSHVEFVATYPATNKKFSVEVKTRNRSKEEEGPVDDVKRLRVGNKLNKALAKTAAYTRVVMIEINVPDIVRSRDLRGWPQAALDQVRHVERLSAPDGSQKASAYVLVTNHAFHSNLDAVDVGAQVLATGCGIPDFGPDVALPGYKAVLESRERHSEMFALLDSMKAHYEIPSTFDGENPELAFLPPSEVPRLKFGETYRIPKPDGTEVLGRLYEATVMEKDKKVFGAYETQAGEHVIATTPVSDAELAAWRRHPDTFFGEVRHVGGSAETFLDLCDFFYGSYENTPRERLLELLKGARDFAALKELPQEELAIIYCERTAHAAFTQVSANKPQPVGILAYGSLISDPREEIAGATLSTKDCTTPFNVEYARSSNKRKGAPTLVPVTEGGARVRAKIFLLNVSVEEATNRLWRREIDAVGSGRTYDPLKNPGVDKVIVERLLDFQGVGVVIYTKICANLHDHDGAKLAQLAIESAKRLDNGRDGISYLAAAKRNGVETPLSGLYEQEILRQLGAADLEDALCKVRNQDTAQRLKPAEQSLSQ
jgi:SEC-C motif